jgi:hypothetical protein
MTEIPDDVIAAADELLESLGEHLHCHLKYLAARGVEEPEYLEHGRALAAALFLVEAWFLSKDELKAGGELNREKIKRSAARYWGEFVADAFASLREQDKAPLAIEDEP